MGGLKTCIDSKGKYPIGRIGALVKSARLVGDVNTVGRAVHAGQCQFQTGISGNGENVLA